MRKNITLFWFRRYLRLQDNAGLYWALKQNQAVLPLFIFDSNILQSLPKDDRRVTFIHQTVQQMKTDLQSLGSDLLVRFGDPIQVLKSFSAEFDVSHIYLNRDYEPDAVFRDTQVTKWAHAQKIEFKSFKDQCVFEKSEVVSDSKKPYTVFTPYKKKWLSQVNEFYLKSYPNELYEANYLKVASQEKMISLKEIGFSEGEADFPELKLSSKMLKAYGEKRDFPYLENATSKIGIHLRFGTISVREVAREATKYSDVWLSEIIWRDFFMQILWHYPHVVKESFRPQYDQVAWRTDKKEFEKLVSGMTGYPLVDAGMRQLNQTGYMHNRVRMVVASFLTKHLLMHWSSGEKYFALKLLDYDLAANNGNWQWAAGTGCDAAPYFRIFNPEAQSKRFDPDFQYVKKWVPEFGTDKYVNPMVDHKFARERALAAFKFALKGE